MAFSRQRLFTDLLLPLNVPEMPRASFSFTLHWASMIQRFSSSLQIGPDKNPISLQRLFAFSDIEPLRIQGLCWSNRDDNGIAFQLFPFTSRLKNQIKVGKPGKSKVLHLKISYGAASLINKTIPENSPC